MAITLSRAGGTTHLHSENKTTPTLDQKRRGAARQITIGELSRRTGVSIKNLRLYAEGGLIRGAGRSESNYRLFDSSAPWVRHIVEARRLGLKLSEIRDARGQVKVRGCGHRKSAPSLWDRTPLAGISEGT